MKVCVRDDMKLKRQNSKVGVINDVNLYFETLDDTTAPRIK